MSDELLCSWDSVHYPPHSAYTTTNAAEVLPGVTRPLPADLLRAWDYGWNLRVAEDLGVVDLVPLPEPPGTTILPFIGGRFVINYGATNRFTATYQVGEGSDFLKQFLEGGEELQSEAAADQERAAATRELITQQWENADENYESYRVLTYDAYRTSLARDWSAASDAELIAAVEEATELCGTVFRFHYYNSVGGGEYTTVLGNLLDEQISGHPPEWLNTITSGLTDVESARPAKAIWDLSRFVQARPELAAEFQTVTADELMARLEDPPSDDWRAFATEYVAFIDELGFRGQRETDPSYQTWNEAPNFVLSSIRADLGAAADRDPHALERKQAGERERLEREIEQQLPAEVLDDYRHALKLAQTMNRGREGTKANWTRACRTYRPPIAELGARLTERGVIEAADDVWFLRLEELGQGGSGTLDGARAKAEIESRKREYELLQQYELPVMFEWPVELLPKATAEQAASASYTGLGISPGTASGKARVVDGAEAAMDAALEPGEILVAPFTDAPWTPLFIPAAGVVVETGGILSHAATVAREFGIPAVAGIRGATSLIPNGAMVTIDGTTGSVTVEP